MTIAQAVAERVESLLAEKEITKGDLIIASGMSKFTLEMLLSGKTKSVSLKTIFALSYGFDISLSQFFEDAIFDYNSRDIQFKER